jgi:hypothetical protein
VFQPYRGVLRGVEGTILAIRHGLRREDGVWKRYAVSLAFLAIGTAVCTEGGGDWKCCAVSSFIVTVIGFVLAFALGLVAAAVGLGWGVGAGAGLLLDVGLTNINVTCSAPSG